MKIYPISIAGLFVTPCSYCYNNFILFDPLPLKLFLDFTLFPTCY
jgi:hypothetical protein